MPPNASTEPSLFARRRHIIARPLVVSAAGATMLIGSLTACAGDGTGRPSASDRSAKGAGSESGASDDGSRGDSSDENSDNSRCGPIVREELDRRYLQHILPGAPEPEYATDPPTSGPHQPAPASDPVETEPIPRPVQVGELEAGRVLLQHHGLTAAEVDELRTLAGETVVVAPNPDLPGGTSVVATSWLHKRSCSSLDLAAIEEFVHQRVGHGPDAEAGGHDHPTETDSTGDGADG